MQLTPNYRLRKPDGTDPVDVQDLNDNMDVLDAEVAKKAEKTGAATDMVVAFKQEEKREQLESGEKLSLSLGKIKKWFADLKKVAFSGDYADLTGKPAIPAGGIADASKIIDDIDDIAANTQAGYMAGALALKKVNSDLGGVKVIPEGSGADVKYYAQLGADAASKKLLGRPEISFYDVSFSLPINSTKVINLDDYIDNGILVGALIKSFSAPWTPANQSFTSSLLNNKVSIDYRANDSGFSASLTLGLYYYVP